VLRALLTAAISLLVGSCGNTTYSNGTPVMLVTATNSHFTSFIVYIAGITLTRDDGNSFNALALEERADLSKNVNLTELLGAPAIPTGTYKQGVITIDFTNAIINYDQNGVPVALAPVDTTGVGVTTQSFTFNFDPNHPLVVNYQQGVKLGLEFDLDASTIINASTGTVTVTPVVVASTVVANQNPVHVRGLFLITNPNGAQNTFVLNSIPFADESLLTTFGAVNVAIDANTVYDFNGTIYTGAAGLAAMASLQLNTPVSAVGTFTDLSGVTPVLHATQVYTGNSQESPLVDHMIGYVSSRSGDTLNVHGALLIGRGGNFGYQNDVTLTVGSSTIVNTDGSSAAGQTNSAVSVGQQIEAIGQLNTGTTPYTMDATQGEMRLQSTRMWGTLLSATPGSLQADLVSVGLFEISPFQFAGTGVTTASDANPASYAVNTGAIDQSATTAGTILQMDGLVSPFGSAPPDFNASAIGTSPSENVDSVLQVEWSAGTQAPFVSSSASGVVVDLTNTAVTLGAIFTGPFTQQLSALPASPLIVPDSTNGTNFSVGGGTNTTLFTFTTFSGFVTQIGTELSSRPVRKLVAVGHYDPSTNSFIAKRVNLVEI